MPVYSAMWPNPCGLQCPDCRWCQTQAHYCQSRDSGWQWQPTIHAHDWPSPGYPGINEFDRLADSGYYEGNQIKQCEDQHIITYVAIPDKSKAIKEQGSYTRDQFNFNAENDTCTCPQGLPLARYGTPRQINNKTNDRYKSKASPCKQCPVRSQCLTDKATTKQLMCWE